MLKDAAGKPLPRVDGAIPFDVTHPIWQQQMRWKLALTVGDRQYIALFHWKENKEIVWVDCGRAGTCEGLRYRDLWSGEEFSGKDGRISWEAAGCDAVILEEICSADC